MGTARPMAQGHETMSTVMAYVSAWTAASDAVLPRAATPTATQTTKVTAARATMTGTNSDAALSASRCILGFDSLASSTMAAMALMVLSPGRRARRTASVPAPLMVPAVTADPACFSTARDSPVSSDSSTSETPETTVPSVGTLASGRTRKVSPYCRSLASTSRAAPPASSSSTRRAVWDCSDRTEMDSRAFWRANAAA
ncbi:hypothetical protein CDD83_7381 [Cordyceps sp. RAO-2017]|nr:hypothetical protein CDD83_7381 [Cordyceps sp. RAO-2017]